MPFQYYISINLMDYKMKMLKTTLLILVSMFSLSLNAAIFKSIEPVQGFYSPLYPSLDLNQINDVKVNTKLDHQMRQIPTRLEISYQNANNLIAKKFKMLNGAPDTFYTIVNGAWVFKQVAVLLKMPEHHAPMHTEIGLFVVENPSNLGNLEHIDVLGPNMMHIVTVLDDVTPKSFSDIESVKYLGKKLTLKLVEKPGYHGFEIVAKWMGHGTKSIFLPHQVSMNAESLAIDLEEIPILGGNEYKLRVRFDDNGSEVTTPFNELYYLLEQSFGPIQQP